MQTIKLLFITSKLTRRIVQLAKQMDRCGADVTIAAPMGKSVPFIVQDKYIRLRKFFGHLYGLGKSHGFKHSVVFDEAATKLANRRNLKKIQFKEEVGIDLSVWTPQAISGNRQTMLLSQYNVLPHQKLILAIEPCEKDISALITAAEKIDRDDYIIAIYGRLRVYARKRANRRIAQARNIMYIGIDNDLPSIMRASFAIMDFSNKTTFFKSAAIAMGRTTAWKGKDPKPNIEIDGSDYTGALRKILSMSIDTRERFEQANLDRAHEFGFDKQIEKIFSLLPGETVKSRRSPKDGYG